MSKILRRGVVMALLVSLMIPYQARPVHAAGESLHFGNWLKAPAPPVLNVGSAGSWDATGSGTACVINDGGTYKMWYTGYNATEVMQIGYATSNNGTNWNRQGSSPVLTPGGAGAWDEEGVGAPCVINDGGTYKMWYTGYQQVGGEFIPQIGYATWDGSGSWVKWDTDGGPVLTPTATWEEKGVHSPWVVKENGTYKMWYTGRSGTPILGNSAIGYATSDNGTNWTKYDGGAAPVVSPTSQAWDQRGVATASVIKKGNSYYMWYTGYAGVGSGNVTVRIGAAKSADGFTNWVKNPNPVLEKEASGWNSGGVGAPCVLKESPTQFRMWYSGLDSQLAPRVGTASITLTQITTTVIMQGDDRPLDGLSVPFMVKLFNPSLTLTWQNILTATPLDRFTTTDWPGGTGNITISSVNFTAKQVTLTISGVVPATYHISLASPHNLVNLRNSVTVPPAGLSISMGTLQEGNADDTYKVDIGDFGILAVAYRAKPGDGNWNASADFNRSGQVTIADFSLLAMNFNELSPTVVTGP